MQAFLSQHFLTVLVILVMVVLAGLQAWQYHLRAMKRLQVSYEKIMNTLLDGFVVQKADGSVVGYNRAAYKILGLSEDELQADASYWARCQACRDDGSPFPGNEYPPLVTLATGQILQNVIMGVTLTSGEQRWLSVNSVPLFGEDEANPSHALATFQDITVSRSLADEVKLARQRLEMALDVGHIGIWEWNVSAGTLTLDDQLFKIYGQSRTTYTPTFENWQNIIHTNDRQRVITELQDAIKKGQNVDSMFRIIHPNGKVRHLRTLGDIVQNTPYQNRSMTGICWDITEQVEREESLQDAKEKAEKASRAKSDFLANMSHEIRTPLNGIFGMLSLLKESNLSESQSEMLVTVESCSEGLLTVLNDILDLSRIESHRLQIDQAPFDLQACMHEVIKLFLPQATQKNLPLSLECSPAVPNFVVGDAARFKQILLNLVSNAIKFTETGEVRLSVSGTDLGAKGFQFVIEVKDTGIGISRENQQRIFEAFSQADSSIARRFGGTGLGLTISASLAKMMGGDLELKSELGKGAIFRLQLPLTLVEHKALHPIQNDRHPRQGMLDPRQRILVVEDNKINQIVVTSLLAKMGFINVDVAEDGLMALQQLELKPYDLILMDMQMPGMDGITATRRIRERMKHQPLIIVAMTANAFDDDRRKCLEAGMNEFLAKPFNRQDLERILSQFSTRKAS